MCGKYSLIHYIYQPNFGILLLLKGSFRERSFLVGICLEQKLVYKENCLLPICKIWSTATAFLGGH